MREIIIGECPGQILITHGVLVTRYFSTMVGAVFSVFVKGLARNQNYPSFEFILEELYVCHMIYC